MISRKDSIPCLKSDFKSGVEPLGNCGLVGASDGGLSHEREHAVHSWKDEIWAAYNRGNLTRTGRDIMLRLLLHRNRGGVCWPSQARLAALAKCSLSTVGRTLRAAQDLGLLAVKACYRRVGGAVRRTVNLYKLICPTETTTSQNDGAGIQKSLFLSSCGVSAPLLAARRAVMEERLLRNGYAGRVANVSPK